MATLSAGVSASWGAYDFDVTSVSASGGTKEVVDMSSGAAGLPALYPTGRYTSPPTVQLEALGSINPVNAVGASFPLTITGGPGVSGQAILTDATCDARVGDLLRFRLTFTLTGAS